MEVAACMAGQWKPARVARPNITSSSIHTSAAPHRNASISRTVSSAMRESAPIIVSRLFQRST